jgi:hypothetical protein
MKNKILVFVFQSLVSVAFFTSANAAVDEMTSVQIKTEKLKLQELQLRRSACENFSFNNDYLRKAQIEILTTYAEYAATGLVVGGTLASFTEHNTKKFAQKGTIGMIAGVFAGTAIARWVNEMDYPQTFRDELKELSNMTTEQAIQEYNNIIKEIYLTDAKIKQLQGQNRGDEIAQ